VLHRVHLLRVSTQREPTLCLYLYLHSFFHGLLPGSASWTTINVHIPPEVPPENKAGHCATVEGSSGGLRVTLPVGIDQLS
jgi:hypothetical protein